jgi:L-ascorbate metabolism protein UlaG (beta-lactamase superfamily)
MDAIEAANVANIIKPRIAVPIHFGDLIGIKEDAEIFIRNLSDGISGVILK